MSDSGKLEELGPDQRELCQALATLVSIEPELVYTIYKAKTSEGAASVFVLRDELMAERLYRVIKVLYGQHLGEDALASEPS